jgi:hypothetical protein
VRQVIAGWLDSSNAGHLQNADEHLDAVHQRVGKCSIVMLGDAAGVASCHPNAPDIKTDPKCILTSNRASSIPDP